MNKLEQTNQTDFSYEEPIFSDFNVELPVEPKPVVPEIKNSKKKKFIIIGLAIFFLILVLVIVIIKLKKSPVEITKDKESEVITKI